MSKSFISAKLPAASWWRYDYNWILACRCVQPAHLSNIGSLVQIEHSMLS